MRGLHLSLDTIDRLRGLAKWSMPLTYPWRGELLGGWTSDMSRSIHRDAHVVCYQVGQGFRGDGLRGRRKNPFIRLSGGASQLLCCGDQSNQ